MGSRRLHWQISTTVVAATASIHAPASVERRPGAPIRRLRSVPPSKFPEGSVARRRSYFGRFSPAAFAAGVGFPADASLITAGISRPWFRRRTRRGQCRPRPWPSLRTVQTVGHRSAVSHCICAGRAGLYFGLRVLSNALRLRMFRYASIRRSPRRN